MRRKAVRGAARRLAGNTRGGGYGGGPSVGRIILTVLSLALIVAAVMIVISIIKPLVDRGQTTLPEDSPAQNTQQLDSPAPGETGTPEDTTPPEASAEPVIPDDQTATGFTLSKSEFTLSDTWPDPITLTVTFLPAGSTGTITWTSSDPEIASVDENGKVSHGTKTGTATPITAAMAGGITQTCKVYNSVTSGAASSAGGTSTALSLNKTDFILLQQERACRVYEGKRHLLRAQLEHRGYFSGHHLRRRRGPARGPGHHDHHLQGGRADPEVHRPLQLLSIHTERPALRLCGERVVYPKARRSRSSWAGSSTQCSV